MSKNILIINGHPAPEKSTAGSEIIRKLSELLPEAQVRHLAHLTSGGSFDVAAEQAALRQADAVVWHFPFYWYSVPALMKKWIDEVLAYGFAYGSSATALHGKQLLLSLTTGAGADDYQQGASMTWPLEAFLPPLLQTAYYCGMKTLKPVWSYSMICIPGVTDAAGRERILADARIHAERIAKELRDWEREEQK